MFKSLHRFIDIQRGYIELVKNHLPASHQESFG